MPKVEKFYHGTVNEAACAIVRDGFNESKMRPGVLKYGRGFYTTQDKAIACSYSNDAAKSVVELEIDTDKLYKCNRFMPEDCAKDLMWDVEYLNNPDRKEWTEARRDLHTQWVAWTQEGGEDKANEYIRSKGYDGIFYSELRGLGVLFNNNPLLGCEPKTC